jgi:hypothetical protein
MRGINHRRRAYADTLRVATAVPREKFLRYRRAKVWGRQSRAGSCVKRVDRIIFGCNVQNVVRATCDGQPGYQQRLCVDLFVERVRCEELQIGTFIGVSVVSLAFQPVRKLS